MMVSYVHPILEDLFTNGFYASTSRDDGSSDLTFEVDVPGIKKEDLSLTRDDNVIVVEGKTGNRSVRKTFSIPSRMSVADVKSTLVDGVLRITVSRKSKKDLIRVPIT